MLHINTGLCIVLSELDGRLGKTVAMLSHLLSRKVLMKLLQRRPFKARSFEDGDWKDPCLQDEKQKHVPF